MKKKLCNEIFNVIPIGQAFYFRFGDEEQFSIIENMIIMHDVEGIALCAPDTINVKLHNTIPLLWLQLSSALRNWQVEEKRNTFLIISDLTNDKINIKYVYAGMPKRFDFRSIPMSSQGNQPSSPLGLTSSADMFECREIMGNPPLTPTTLAVTMTQYDWISNTVQINLIDSTGNTPQIPLISQTVSRQIYNEYKTAAKQMKDYAMFSPSLKPPAITQNGIAAVVPQKVAIKDYRWMMHGSVRVSVAPGAMVNKTDSKGDSSELPAAIVSAMVIVNKLDNKEPSWITLQLPVLTPCKVGELVDASFSVDLKQYNGEFKDTGLYQVFVACGAFVAGPFALEVAE